MPQAEGPETLHDKVSDCRSCTLDHVPELEVLGHIRMGSETLKGTGAFFNCIYLRRLQVQLQALVNKLPKLRDLTISGKIFEYNQVGHSIKLNFNLLVTHNQKYAKRMPTH